MLNKDKLIIFVSIDFLSQNNELKKIFDLKFYLKIVLYVYVN